MTENPFAKDEYFLSNCRLNRLVSDQVQELGAYLCGIDPWKRLKYNPDNLAQYLKTADNSLHRYTINFNDENAGLVCVRNPWLKGPYLELLAIWSQFNNLGLGREVISWIAKEAMPTAKNIWALVSRFNYNALKFYNKNGFIEITPLTDLVKEGFDEILLRKTL